MNRRQAYALALRQTLLSKLNSHGLVCRAGSTSLFPSTVRLHVIPTAGTKVAQVQTLERDIAVALAVPRVKVGVAHTGIYVEVPLPADMERPLSFAGTVRKPLAMPVPRGKVRYLLGMDTEGQTLVGNLASVTTPHILVAGTTGSGKTNLLKGMVLSLALLNRPNAVQMVVVDDKAHEYDEIVQTPHFMVPLAYHATDWLPAAGLVIEEMERRLKEPVKRDTPHLVLVIDELAKVLREFPGLEPHLRTLVAEGRGVGCHAILGTQRPTAEVVQGMIAANIPARLVGVCVSAREAALAAGYPDSGAHRLTRGQFVAIGEGGRFIQFVAPLLCEREVSAAVKTIGGHPGMPTAGGSFVRRVEAQAPAQATGSGKPAMETPQEVVDWLVEWFDLHGEFPSKRSIQRRLGELAGVQLASLTRADRALAAARQRLGE